MQFSNDRLAPFLAVKSAYCRAAIRRIAGAPGETMPVVIVDGAAPPCERGRSFHFTTPGGRPVYHPSAYRRAKGRPVYHHSTRRIEVGADWLRAALGAGKVAT